MTARVAVIVPCHDDGPLILDAVSSIDEVEPVEILVIDDASTEAKTRDALEILRRQGVRVLRLEKNVGVAAARTLGLAATTASYVFPLDADDLLLPGTLARMADLLDADPGAAVCFGDYSEFGVHETVRYVPENIDPYRVAYSNEWGASLLRRSTLESIGGWTPRVAVSEDFAYEDWHVWMSLAERSERGIHAGRGFVTYKRRIEPGRRLTSDRRRHARAYCLLRELHPGLYGRLPEHRRRSSLRRVQKLLYPVLYGRRPRFPFEPRIRFLLDRLGLGPDRLLGRRHSRRGES